MCAKESQKYIPRMRIAGLRIYTSLTFLDIAKLLSTVDVLIYTLSSRHEISCFFTPSLNLVLSDLFNLCVKCCLIVLSCTFKITTEIEQ